MKKLIGAGMLALLLMGCSDDNSTAMSYEQDISGPWKLVSIKNSDGSPTAYKQECINQEYIIFSQENNKVTWNYLVEETDNNCSLYTIESNYELSALELIIKNHLTDPPTKVYMPNENTLEIRQELMGIRTYKRQQ